MPQAMRLVAAAHRLKQPIRFSANREVAERVVTRIERFRPVTDAPERPDADGLVRRRGWPQRTHRGASASWHSNGPNPLRLRAYSRRVRVLALEPIRRAYCAVTRPLPLRHDAFEAELAGVFKTVAPSSSMCSLN
jgi:hypothetical protein